MLEHLCLHSTIRPLIKYLRVSRVSIYGDGRWQQGGGGEGERERERESKEEREKEQNTLTMKVKICYVDL